MRKEYFITYRRAVQVGGTMTYKDRNAFIKARSGSRAWSKLTQLEHNFNGLELISIKKV